MNDQLLCGLVLGACALGAGVAGLAWLATAALVAAAPFLAVGALLALGGVRGHQDGPAGSTR